jgi:hypothetical protein
MPRVSPNFQDVAAGIPLLPEGEVFFSVGEPKPFARTNNDNVQVFGIMYQLVTEGPDGSPLRIPHNLFLHNKEGFSFAKQFAMACLGYDKSNREDENSFNAQYGGTEDYIDVDFEGDVGKVNAFGKLYEDIKGTKVRAHAKLVPNKKTEEMQNQFTFTPVK